MKTTTPTKRKTTPNKAYNMLEMDKNYMEGYDAGAIDQAKILKGRLDAMYFKGDNEGYKRGYKEEIEIEIPKIKEWKKGYDSDSSDMKLVDKITWVLTAMNVAILISLVIKNI